MPGERAFYENRGNYRDQMTLVHHRNFSFPLHLHPELELFWLQSGALCIETGSQSIPLEPGDLAFFFPNTVHAYQSGGEGSHIMLIAASSLLGDLFPTLTRFRPAEPVLRAAALHPDIVYAIQRLSREGVGGQEVRRALLHLILARILEASELVPVGEPQESGLTTRLMEYLSLHFREPLALDDAARALGVSRYHLSRVFSQRIGSSFSDYLSFLRLNDAQELLLGTDRSISDIALDCGFLSQRTFNRAFQKLFRTTPRQFRAERRRQPN